MQYSHWEIAHTKFVDDYGIPIKQYGDGSQFIPDSAQIYYAALSLCESVNMSYTEVLNLRYDVFVQLSMLARAKAWVAPTKTPRDKEREEFKRRIRR